MTSQHIIIEFYKKKMNKPNSKNHFISFLFIIIIFASCNNAVKNSDRPTASNDTAVHKKTPVILTIKGDPEAGSKNFKMYCRACHTLSDQKITGPGMRNVFERIPPPQNEWLKKYILNSSKLRENGDVYAIQLYKDYNGSNMPAFENILSDKDINDILYFLYNNK